MAKILLGIALAVMLATGILGYFYTIPRIKNLQTDLAGTKTVLGNTKVTLAKTENKLKDTEASLVAANLKIEEKDKEIATQKGQLDDLTAKLTAATTELAAKTAEATDLQNKLQAALSSVPGGKIEDLIKQVEDLKANLAKAETEVAETKSMLDALGQQKKKVEDDLAVLVEYKKSRERIIARPGLSGRIVAVNAGWNFVVLNIGDKQGVVLQAPLLVIRDGQPIAKARITSVEPATSIADLIPNSIVKGVTVQPGDTVVFEGRNSTTQPTIGATTPR